MGTKWREEYCLRPSFGLGASQRLGKRAWVLPPVLQHVAFGRAGPSIIVLIFRSRTGLKQDLVEPVLSATVPDHAPHFFVFAWNPDARVGEGTGHLPENSGKKLHIRTISEHYGYVFSPAFTFCCYSTP